MKDLSELRHMQDEIRDMVGSDTFIQTLCRLNCADRLDDFMTLLKGTVDAVEDAYHPSPDGRILVVGGTKCKRNELSAIGKTMGVAKNRFEFVLDFTETKKYPFSTLYLNEGYAAVMVGPIPHKAVDMDDVICNLEHTRGYPPVIRLGSNELKITKSNFRLSLEDAISKKIIAVGA